MTVSEFIAEYGLGFTCKRVSPEIFRCRISCDDRGMDFFHKSSKEPTVVEALTRLAKAAQQHMSTKIPNDLRGAGRDWASFHHWCAVYGYDPKADHKRYLIIRRRAEQLKYVIGIEAFKQLLEIT